jgi:hypothetical protein
VKDLDREVLAAFAEYLHLLLLEDLARPVMGVDDLVSELELYVLDLASDLEFVRQCCVFGYLCGNGCPPLL